jgi:hypothetical protein
MAMRPNIGRLAAFPGHVPNVSAGYVPAPPGQGSSPTLPPRFFNSNKSSATTGGGDSEFGGIAKGLGGIAAGIYGGPLGALAAGALGSQIHFANGGGHRTAPVGWCREVASDHPR